MSADAIIAAPGWITTDPDGQYVIVDQSDRDIKVVDSVGRLHRRIGRAGPNPGEFSSLTGGGSLGYRVVAYDFGTERLSVFDSAGRLSNVVQLSAAGRHPPLAVFPVDDTLLLATLSPIGNDRRPLIRLMDIDGEERAALFQKDDYFQGDPDLIQAAVVVAAARDGIIAASLLSADSLWVYDYAGRPLASTQLVVGGAPVPTVRELRARNGGRMQKDDGTRVLAGQRLVAAVVVIDPATIVVQVLTYPPGNVARLDRTDGGDFLVYRLDRQAGELSLVRTFSRRAGLVGQAGAGEALLLGYVDDQYRTVTIERITAASLDMD